MIKLVAFDWNGTIFSDALACTEGINDVLKHLNLKPISVKKFRAHFDVPLTKAYLAFNITPEQLEKRGEEITKIFHSNYEIRASKVRTRSYAKELLRWLYQSKIEAVIFSNHIDEPIRKQLRRLKIDKFFDTVLANSSLTSALKGRNKKEKLKDYINGKNLLPSEVIIIGDSIEEVEIGKDIGVKTIAITGGFCSTSRLKKVNPDYLIGNLKEVISIIS